MDYNNMLIWPALTNTEKKNMASNGEKAACMDVQQLRRARRSDGPAAVLAIGTANPENWVDQSTYADYYFGVTNSQHMTELKTKFQRICDKSQIRKRHLTHTGEMLAKHPVMTEYMGQSFDERQSIVIREVPMLGAVAAQKALAEWGRPRTEITHMVVCATNGIDMPGTDFALLKMLGLRPGVRRVMMYQQGCFAGGTALRVAKDMAENNGEARVLLVCSEVTAMIFRGPSESDMSSMVGQAIFADGAAALVVGADPHTALGERAVFEVVHAAQTVLPDSDDAVGGQLTEAGLTFHLRKDLPAIVGEHIEACLREAFAEGLGLEGAEMPEWNELFWAVHPGGPAILDGVEAQLGLDGDKLAATRHVLREYGNMSSACVLFILDELRRKRKNALAPRPRLGALLGFGPGLTVEAVLLRSVPDPCPAPVS